MYIKILFVVVILLTSTAVFINVVNGEKIEKIRCNKNILLNKYLFEEIKGYSVPNKRVKCLTFINNKDDIIQKWCNFSAKDYLFSKINLEKIIDINGSKYEVDVWENSHKEKLILVHNLFSASKQKVFYISFISGRITLDALVTCLKSET